MSQLGLARYKLELDRLACEPGNKNHIKHNMYIYLKYENSNNAKATH
jgi:hypothetical protein